MVLLGFLGVSLLLTIPAVYFLDCGFRGDPGDIVLWFMSKTPEQIMLMQGASIAGFALLSASLAQTVWSWRL